MLRVTVELVPHGDESRTHVIETMDIWNSSIYPDENNTYQYGYKIDNLADFIKDGKLNREKILTTGEIFGQCRKKNVWNLVSAILKKEIE
jgi:hypothetical protein